MLSKIFNEFFVEILVAITITLGALGLKLPQILKNRRRSKSEAIIWAPGEKQICFVLNSNGKREIHIYEVNTGKKTKLRISIADSQLPVWSPDGSKIAFVSDKDGNKEIYIVNSNGSNLRRITNDPADDMCPQWSPDGTKIAFFTRKNGTLKISTIDITKIK